ncbi:hypothetical protein SDC9_160970 [bioreactor metagenome]|uniref:Uncharacterized protein n=1 Tax=bioreactor metagenome TaxID=1076179 RepID=A0A645FH35_9ZZZZ
MKAPFDIEDLALILRADQSAGFADAARAPRSADAVDVVLELVGYVVIDHQVDVVHVDTACGDIGGHKHGALSASERAHDRIALVLTHIAVQAASGQAEVEELLLKSFHFPARIAEYQRQPGLLPHDQALNRA